MSRAEAMAARRDLLRLLLIAVALLGAGLGLRHPWPADEPRFALVARDMVASGAWLFPRIGADLYADKPPLFFWCIAFFYKLTGSLRVAFLLPALAAGLATLAAVHDLARRLWGRQAAVCAAATLLFTLQFLSVMRGGQIDPLLCGLETLSLYALLRHLLLGSGWGWYALGAFLAGLGVITKGVGFLPILVLIPYGLARARGWPGLYTGRGGWRWAVLGCGGLLAGIAVWFVPMLLAVAAAGTPELLAYRDEILFRQTLTRYANAWHHVEPWYYFLVSVIPGLWLPWTPLLFWLGPRWRAAWRERSAAVWLPLGWLLLVLLFFSLSHGKRGVYVFPLLPALALAAAPYLPGIFARRAVQWTGVMLAALLVLVCGVAATALLLGQPRAVALAAQVGVHSPVPFLLLALCTLAAGVLSLWRWRLLAWPAVLAAVVLVWALVLMPRFDAERSGRGFMTRVLRRVDAAHPLGMVRYKEQFLLYLDRPIVNFGHNRMREGMQQFYDAARWVSATHGAWLLIPEAGLRECFEGYGVRHYVGRSAGENWWLVEGPADPRCVARGTAERYEYGPDGAHAVAYAARAPGISSDLSGR
ncbi:MAG: glycosyltransferase family 39 protein [Gammaproteobacteria bacterium]|nr:glycosyltransferase family 39 protein [Gammaproteobacteria bacterium]